MIYKYIRFSTDKQDEKSQGEIIDQYLAARGMKADETFKDEGVSGGVSFYDRHLYELVRKLNEGDTLVVSEISRIGRSMSDLNLLINKELKPRKVRLIVIKMNIDMDCANLKAIDEMMLFSFSFSAQIEKEMIQERTKAKIDTIKREIEEKGSYTTAKGKTITRLGCPRKPTKQAHEAAGRAASDKAGRNPNNANFERYIAIFEERNGSMDDCSDGETWERLADELNRLGYKTARGLDYNQIRTRAMYRNMVQRRITKKQIEQKQTEKEAQPC